MKTLKYIGLFIASFLFAACAVDEMGSADAESLADNSPVVISISDKNLIPVDMAKTRAGVDMNTILSTVNDLNVRINLKDKSVKFIYCTKSGVEANDAGASFIPNHDLKSMAPTSPVQLHLGIKASQVQSVEVIANYGKAIKKDADWTGAKESEASPASGNALKEPALLPQAKNSISTMTCMMYGKAEALAEGSIHSQKGTPCKYFDIALKRTRAVITLKILGTDLKDGVEIDVKELRLYNAPKECVLTSLAPGKGNKIAATSDVYGPMTTLVGLGTLTNGSKPGTRTFMGGHFDEVPADQTAEWAFPIFMYENMQGTNPNLSGKAADKYPEGIKTVDDAKEPSKNFKASYIEIVGEYKYREPSKGKALDPVKVGGTIIYRFFLGADALQDFNVEGNHYYKLTLNLKGFGGAKEDGKLDASGNLIVNEEDVSWRVDMNTKEWGFEKDQFDFDSHHVAGVTNVVGTNWKFSKVLKGDQYSSWLTINVVDKNDGMGEWVNPTTVISGHYTLNIVNGQLKFNLQPMLYMKNGELDPGGQFDETTYKKPVNYREMVIEVMNTDTKQTQTVTVRQYVPIPVTVNGETFFMERFEEYGVDANGVVTTGYPWMYKGNNLTNLKAIDGTNATYHWGNPNKNGVGLNSSYLRDKKSVSRYCYEKGLADDLQGADVYYYALPSQTMMEAMFKMSATYDKSWGPFEPMHIYEDYWTSTVEQATPTVTQYYDANSGTYKPTTPQHDRDQIKRARAVYTVHKF